ncbi:MAG TPA: sugar phosphate isomerase/epimerase [Thermoflexia bacterium]|jgi:sugar phosphate isomerase/epimerase|nr:sugar phosphate isomerase/epimerase [Thermoflexia bacterium]
MLRLAIATKQVDIAPYIALASKYQVGLEIQVFGYHPNLLDGEWKTLVKRYKRLLREFAGERALHGAFYDMSSASPDNRVQALVRARYLLSLQIAAELEARTVVFHANYLPFIRRPEYLHDWTCSQVEFWANLLQEAERFNLLIALENMWEPRPEIIANLLRQINSPWLGACLDVGHVHLYTDSTPLSGWIDQLQQWVVHCHINNHRGYYDEHLPLDAPEGVIDYQTVLPLLETLPRHPVVCLEMNHLEDLERSLRYLGR